MNIDSMTVTLHDARNFIKVIVRGEGYFAMPYSQATDELLVDAIERARTNN